MNDKNTFDFKDMINFALLILTLLNVVLKVIEIVVSL